MNWLAVSCAIHRQITYSLFGKGVMLPSHEEDLLRRLVHYPRGSALIPYLAADMMVRLPGTAPLAALGDEFERIGDRDRAKRCARMADLMQYAPRAVAGVGPRSIVKCWNRLMASEAQEAAFFALWFIPDYSKLPPEESIAARLAILVPLGLVHPELGFHSFYPSYTSPSDASDCALGKRSRIGRTFDYLDDLRHAGKLLRESHDCVGEPRSFEYRKTAALASLCQTVLAWSGLSGGARDLAMRKPFRTAAGCIELASGWCFRRRTLLPYRPFFCTAFSPGGGDWG